MIRHLPRFVVVLATILFITACSGGGTGSTADAAASASAGPADPSEAAGGAPEFVDGVLQPLPDGFPDHEITIVVVDEPGSSDGVYARHLQTALREISPVPIEVLDRGDVGTYPTWEAMLWTADQPGGNEGYFPVIYVLPGSVIDFHTAPIENELGVTLDDLNMIITTEVTPYVVTSRKDAPWGDSFEAMVEYAKENPGEVKYLSRSPGSGGYTALARYQELLGITFDERVGGSHDEIQAAIGAGEADIGITQVENAMTHWEADRIELLMVTGDERAPEPWAHVPSAADMGMPGEPWAQNRGLAVTKETSDEHRDWLFALFQAATEDPEFQENRLSLPGNSLVVLDHDETRALAERALEYSEDVIRRLGIHWEDQ
jgi:tripartite-type tricarboxylate transporter receptor subunit TctC